MRDDLFDIFYISTELYLMFISLVILLYGVFRKNTDYKKLLFPFIFVICFSFFFLYNFNPAGESVVFNGLFYSSDFLNSIKVMILISTLVLFCLLSGVDFKATSNMSRFELPIIIMFAVIGMMLLVSANDFISMYLSLEMMSLCLYVLAAFNRDDIKSSEAGLKYFILGALSSGIMLFGISLIYGFVGTVNFSIIAALFSGSGSEIEVLPAVQVGLVMVITGLLFKLSAAPFHFWTPDVYEGSPTIITSFFATVPKIAGVVILYRILHQPFISCASTWSQVILLAACLSMIVGAVGGINQKNIKRLLAYSSINHIGFILVAVGIDSSQSLFTVILYLVIYLIMNFGIFAVVLSMKKSKEEALEISSLSGIAKKRPAFAAVIAVLMFSMAGIPPLFGFFAKFYILKLAIDNSYFAVAMIAIISSVIAAFYYLRIVKIMYFDEVSNMTISNDKTNNLSFIYSLSALINISGFIFFDDFVAFLLKY